MDNLENREPREILIKKILRNEQLTKEKLDELDIAAKILSGELVHMIEEYDNATIFFHHFEKPTGSNGPVAINTFSNCGTDWQRQTAATVERIRELIKPDLEWCIEITLYFHK